MSEPDPPVELRLPDPPLPDRGFPPWMERWVWTYLREPSLWPVALALLGHAMILVAPVMLFAWRDGNPVAWLALSLLLGGTGHLVWLELRHSRRPGAVTLALALTWAAAGGVAWAGWRWGLL